MYAEMMNKVANHIDFIIGMVNEKELKKEVPENLNEGFENSFEQLIKPACSRFGNFEYKDGFVIKLQDSDEDEDY